MRLAIYHRVSTIDQDPALADRELRDYAARSGAEVILDLREQASGAWNGRPEFQRVIDAARRRQIDCVLVWKLDRFGRSALDILANIRVLEDHGVRFICLTQGLDIRPGGDPISRLTLTVMAAMAEFERSLIAERTRLGLAKVKASGRKLGRPFAAGPKHAQVAELRAAGKSWQEVATELGCTVAMARRRASDSSMSISVAQRASREVPPAP